VLLRLFDQPTVIGVLNREQAFESGNRPDGVCTANLIRETRGDACNLAIHKPSQVRIIVLFNRGEEQQGLERTLDRAQLPGTKTEDTERGQPLLQPVEKLTTNGAKKIVRLASARERGSRLGLPRPSQPLRRVLKSSFGDTETGFEKPQPKVRPGEAKTRNLAKPLQRSRENETRNGCRREAGLDLARAKHGRQSGITRHVIDATAREATRYVEGERILRPVNEVDASTVRGRAGRRQLRAELEFASGGNNLPGESVQIEATGRPATKEREELGPVVAPEETLHFEANVRL
jgi:hypothetical protein